MNPKKHVVICVQEFVCVEVKIIQFSISAQPYKTNGAGFSKKTQ